MFTQKVIDEERTSIVENCKENEDMEVKDPKGRAVFTGIPECERMTDGFCNSYLWPERKWAGKVCPLSPLASAKIIADTMGGYDRVNPLKMSKRGMRQ